MADLISVRYLLPIFLLFSGTKNSVLQNLTIYGLTRLRQDLFGVAAFRVSFQTLVQIFRLFLFLAPVVRLTTWCPPDVLRCFSSKHAIVPLVPTSGNRKKKSKTNSYNFRVFEIAILHEPSQNIWQLPPSIELRTIWKIRIRVSRILFLVDRQSLILSRKSIYVTSWDYESLIEIRQNSLKVKTVRGKRNGTAVETGRGIVRKILSQGHRRLFTKTSLGLIKIYKSGLKKRRNSRKIGRIG